MMLFVLRRSQSVFPFLLRVGMQPLIAFFPQGSLASQIPCTAHGDGSECVIKLVELRDWAISSHSMTDKSLVCASLRSSA